MYAYLIDKLEKKLCIKFKKKIVYMIIVSQNGVCCEADIIERRSARERTWILRSIHQKWPKLFQAIFQFSMVVVHNIPWTYLKLLTTTLINSIELTNYFSKRVLPHKLLYTYNLTISTLDITVDYKLLSSTVFNVRILRFCGRHFKAVSDVFVNSINLELKWKQMYSTAELALWLVTADWLATQPSEKRAS